MKRDIDWEMVKDVLIKYYENELLDKEQSYSTALIVYKLFGGEIKYGISEEKGRHYWNVVDGVEVDLSSDIYGGDGYQILSKETFKEIKTLEPPFPKYGRYLKQKMVVSIIRGKFLEAHKTILKRQ